MWNGCSRYVVGSLVLLLMAGALLPVPSVRGAPSMPPAPAAATHDPIVIEGNGGFTAANGVISGSGTAANPYVIGPWDIDASNMDGVQVRNTSAYFLLKDVNVTGFVYQGSPYTGAVFVGVAHGSVARLNASWLAGGIVLEGGSHLNVSDSHFWAILGYGLVAHDTDNVTVAGDDFRGTWHGVHLIDAPNATLRGNLFDKSSITLDTLNRHVLDTTSIAPDNLLSGLPIRYYRNVSGITIDGLPTGQLIVADSTDVRVANLSVSNGETGLQFVLVDGLRVTSSSINSTLVAGLYLLNVTNAFVSGVTVPYVYGPGALLENVTNVSLTAISFYQSPLGMVIRSSRNVTLSGLTVSVLWTAVSALNVDGLDVSSSQLSDNLIGLDLSAVRHGHVSANSFDRNGPVSPYFQTGEGIRVSSSADVEFEHNNFSGNGRGVWAAGSSGLRFFANRFVGNDVQAADDSAADLWNASYPGGGNYWSDYKGYDDCRGPAQDDCTGSDGLGDTAYALPTSPEVLTPLDLDHYPLVPVNPPNALPVASVVASATSAWTGQTLTFDGSSSHDSDGSVVAYAWAFGDGLTGTTPSVPHAYAASGNYTVTLTVTDNRHATNSTSLHIRVATWVRPVVALVVWSSPEGYELPIPRDWTRHENWTSAGSTSDLYANGTYNGTPANLLVDSNSEPTAREDAAYLGLLMNQTVDGVRQQSPGVVVSDVRYLTLSGHGAVVFVLRYGSLVYQDIAFVSSSAHRRTWLILLTAAATEEANLNGTFEQMLQGFTITAEPPGGSLGGPLSGPLSLWVVVAVGATAAAATVGVAAWLLVRRRRRSAVEPSPAPSLPPDGPPKTP